MSNPLLDAVSGTSVVTSPAQYTQQSAPFECIDVAGLFGFRWGNVVKYIWRRKDKGHPAQDADKALWYAIDAYLVHESFSPVVMSYAFNDNVRAMTVAIEERKRRLRVLVDMDWADAGEVWEALAGDSLPDMVDAVGHIADDENGRTRRAWGTAARTYLHATSEDEWKRYVFIDDAIKDPSASEGGDRR